MQSALKADMAASALRKLAADGYLSPDQLSAMEAVVYGKTAPAAATSTGLQWLSVQEACDYCRLSRPSLWKHFHLGHLAIHKVGRRCLVERGDLDAFILKGQENAWPSSKKTKMTQNLYLRRIDA